MADISKIKLPNGTTYDIKDTTARNNGKVSGVKGNAESTYRTGNVNLTAANVGAIPTNTVGNTKNLVRPTGLRGLDDNTLQPLINTTRANRLAFLPADQIIIEQTVDGGATWTDAGVPDDTKVALFSETRPPIALPKIDGKMNLLCGLRITITAMKYNVPAGTAETAKYNYWNSNYARGHERYCQLKEMYFWLNSNNNTIGIKVERATGAASTTWYTIFDDSSYYMAGWPGCNYIRFSQHNFGGGTNQPTNMWNYRITLMTRGQNGTTTMATGYETNSQSIFEIRGYGDAVWIKTNEYMANDKMYAHDYKQNVTFPARVNASSFNGYTINSNVPANAKFTDTTYTANTSKLVTTTVPNVTSVGSAPTLGTAIPADDITAWTTNTPTNFTVSGEKLTITKGTAASLSYTAKSIPNVTSVGSAPTLGTAITVATGSVASNGGGASVATGITAS